ncbi:FMN-dependent NADH-azoreductase [Qipengyuania huizhouensis]|uniref:FMN-dependent NADH-azoreductase n=1 Tax=Qipengyuania huizhouensis TaxID=2867245 RepID=UPI001C87C848|nr:NAD(P)H-dependent oxidoreductase [Qipengyuania huizhouensis]MBX7461114.1 NAD(P)H-dependent oxidoreductase [Qipengyuania huizhouensis]
MSTILHITASIRNDESVSRSLGKRLVERLAENQGAKVVTRDLAKNDLPYIDAERFAANLAPYAERSPEQRDLANVADELIEELQEADTIVFSVPVYNFSVPATVKAWADLVARAGTTFRYTENGPEGLLTGKKVYITAASGGTAMGSEIDFMSPWLKFFLGFLGMTDVELVAADGIMGEGGEEKIAEAHQEVEKLAA